MNKFLQKWIDDLIPEMQDGFSASQMKDKLFDYGKTLKYLENTTSIGAYLARHQRAYPENLRVYTQDMRSHNLKIAA